MSDAMWVILDHHRITCWQLLLSIMQLVDLVRRCPCQLANENRLFGNVAWNIRRNLVFDEGQARNQGRSQGESSELTTSASQATRGWPSSSLQSDSLTLTLSLWLSLFHHHSPLTFRHSPPPFFFTPPPFCSLPLPDIDILLLQHCWLLALLSIFIIDTPQKKNYSYSISSPLI